MSTYKVPLPWREGLAEGKKGVRIERFWRDFIGFVLREGSVNLPPPRDCDRDESRKDCHCPAVGGMGRRGD